MNRERQQKINALKALQGGNAEPLRTLTEDAPLFMQYREQDGMYHLCHLDISLPQDRRPIGAKVLTKNQFENLQTRLDGRTLFIQQ